MFEILGEDENDLSYSLGYVLSQCPLLLKLLVKRIYGKLKFSNAIIKMQENAKDKGYTDFEINLDNKYLFIIEAKKGWNLPTTKQLKRYLPRFREFNKRKRKFLILSDCSEEYFKQNFPDSLYNVAIQSLMWADLLDMVHEVYPKVSNKEKTLLSQLNIYLNEVVVMENQESNWVYVVSLASNTPSWSELSWKDVVYKRNHYFYPQGKIWPKIPPNYIGFRYDGKLQSLHHVEKYEVVDDVHKYIPEIKKGELRNMFLLWLGPSFEPRKEIPNGNVWTNGRFWCMLDTLFTSRTIKEAIEISDSRKKK